MLWCSDGGEYECWPVRREDIYPLVEESVSDAVGVILWGKRVYRARVRGGVLDTVSDSNHPTRASAQHAAVELARQMGGEGK